MSNQVLIQFLNEKNSSYLENKADGNCLFLAAVQGLFNAWSNKKDCKKYFEDLIEKNKQFCSDNALSCPDFSAFFNDYLNLGIQEFNQKHLCIDSDHLSYLAACLRAQCAKDNNENNPFLANWEEISYLQKHFKKNNFAINECNYTITTDVPSKNDLLQNHPVEIDITELANPIVSINILFTAKLNSIEIPNKDQKNEVLNRGHFEAIVPKENIIGNKGIQTVTQNCENKKNKPKNLQEDEVESQSEIIKHPNEQNAVLLNIEAKQENKNFDQNIPLKVPLTPAKLDHTVNVEQDKKKPQTLSEIEIKVQKEQLNEFKLFEEKIDQKKSVSKLTKIANVYITNLKNILSSFFIVNTAFSEKASSILGNAVLQQAEIDPNRNLTTFEIVFYQHYYELLASLKNDILEKILAEIGKLFYKNKDFIYTDAFDGPSILNQIIKIIFEQKIVLKNKIDLENKTNDFKAQILNFIADFHKLVKSQKGLTIYGLEKTNDFAYTDETVIENLINNDKAPKKDTLKDSGSALVSSSTVFHSAKNCGREVEPAISNSVTHSFSVVK